MRSLRRRTAISSQPICGYRTGDGQFRRGCTNSPLSSIYLIGRTWIQIWHSFGLVVARTASPARLMRDLLGGICMMPSSQTPASPALDVAIQQKSSWMLLCDRGFNHTHAHGGEASIRRGARQGRALSCCVQATGAGPIAYWLAEMVLNDGPDSSSCVRSYSI